MNAMERKALYDRLCFALTNYEMPEEQGVSEEDAIADMYDVLVEIQNSWDELISEEEE